MTTLKTGNGANTTTYTYDNLSRVTKITDPMGLTETYTYDLNNNLLTKKTKNGDTLTYTYDAMNRVTKESSGSIVKGQYTYNAYNKVATETNGNSEIRYGYSSSSGLIINCYSTVGADTVLAMYTYDSKYNCTNISFGKVDSKGNFSDIHRQQFTYDTENRLKTVAENYNESSYVTVATYTYDANGNVSKTALGNGVSTTYAYDKANNLTTLTSTNSAGTISKYTYTYLPDGNVSKKTESTGKVTTYTYDNLNRLKTEAITGTTSNKSYSYTYDKAGNRARLAVTGAETYTTTYSYDKNNRLLEDQTYRPSEGITDINTYVYDKNGNQLRKFASQSLDENGTTAISAGSLTDTDFNVEIYGYNAFNQLISYKDSDGTTASYTYLANGLRDSKTLDGTTTYFLWNGTNILADFDENSNFTNVYSRGLQLIKNDSNTYYTFNGHGDVTALTNSSGIVTKSYDYDAFGVEINKSDTDTNPWCYCGEYYDTETESTYLRARYYSPTTGRFTTEDPVRDGLNWYAYCVGNPLMYIDPKGLTLVLEGTKEENSLFLCYLQSLTDDVVSYNVETGEVTLHETNKQNFPIGTELLRKLDASDVITYIRSIDADRGNGGSLESFGGELISCSVSLNLDNIPEYTVMYEGNDYSETETPQQYIRLAHELIHVYRRIDGIPEPSIHEYEKQYYTYTYLDNNGYAKDGYGSPEELETVGIGYTNTREGTTVAPNSYKYTENIIREEHGLPTRVSY